MLESQFHEGFLKWTYPQIIHWMGFSIINNPAIKGYHLWNPSTCRFGLPPSLHLFVVKFTNDLTPARRHRIARIARLETQRAPSILTGRRGKTSIPLAWIIQLKLVGGFNPSEKYESQLGLYILNIWEKNVPNISKPPTSYFLVSYMMTCCDSYIPLHNYTSLIIVYHWNFPAIG